MSDMTSFKNLGLSDVTVEALRKKGFEEPTKIQAAVIPLLLDGTPDVIGQAQTGTGKTAAFGLPFVELLEENAGHVQAIVLAPTRELAVQAAEEINSLKGKKRLSVVPIYGGQSYSEQFRKLKQGIDIVVGTPGRIIDHIHRGSLKLDQITYLVLDEADEMLNMGFVDDMEEIMRYANPERKMLLFSATMPKMILDMAKKYMPDYKLVSVTKEDLTTNLTEQIYFEVRENDKFEALCRIIDIEPEFYAVVFCRTKVQVDWVSSKLLDRGYGAEGLHGDLSQHQRERIMEKFKHKRINILVATDVAARGIDVQDLTHVINFSLPQDPESYVHRIGRTGRAGKEGTAITFVTPAEYRKLMYIKRVAKTEIRKEKIPTIPQVIQEKRNRIYGEIQSIIDEDQHLDFYEMATTLIENLGPADALAATLRHAYEGLLDEHSYQEISEVTLRQPGRTRLFVALGRNKGMSPKKLADYIEKETGVSNHKIQNIQIYDEFSFIMVPFEEAEVILKIFREKKKGRHSIVEPAKESKNKSSKKKKRR